jgi:transketolase
VAALPENFESSTDFQKQRGELGKKLTEFSWNKLDSKAVDTARVLAADAVEKVGNGHPGTAISLAPVAYLLFNKVMRHDPKDSTWVGRDRFILSVGHSSLTLYNQLFLSGYGLELDDLKALRTWQSKTPGHPEYGHTAGVEITTGPLGQGLASAVGFAYASRFERGLFDPNAKAGESPFDHHIFCIAGDGDMQEGVTAEASSLAGHQKLGNLIVLYDANQISIEDDVQIAFTEDLEERYRSYGWHVQVVDWRKTGEYKEDLAELYRAIQEAKSVTNKPSLITIRTIIGWPSPGKQNTGKIHGSALGAEELRALKLELGFDPEKFFDVDSKVLDYTRGNERLASLRDDWEKSFEQWGQANPAEKSLFDRVQSGNAPEELEQSLPFFEYDSQVSTRAASGRVINAIAKVMPELWGGSADLAESNNTTISDAKSFVPAEHSTKEWSGNQYGRVLHFGIREHAMGAILNGISLHGKTRAFGGTFLIFSDYMRPSVRLAALMGISPIFVWTHDSMALGEDGPTHQPIEQLATLRAIPGLDVIRPSDANEVAIAWKKVLERRQGPAGIALSRQNLPVIPRGIPDATGVAYASHKEAERGAYVLADASNGSPEVILIATGSEVQLAIEARLELESKGVATRVVAAPCLEWFEEQNAEYKESVLPAGVKNRISVEAGLSLGWQKYLGSNGDSVSFEHFGASADHKTLFEKFGMTSQAIVKKATELLERKS